MSIARAFTALGLAVVAGVGCAQILGADFDKPFEPGAGGSGSTHTTSSSSSGVGGSTSMSSSSSSGNTSSSSGGGGSTSSSSGSGGSTSSSSSSSGDLPPCANGQQDVGETDVDCGGQKCGPCAEGKKCGSFKDCAAGGVCANGLCCVSNGKSEGCAGKTCGTGTDKCGTQYDCGGCTNPAFCYNFACCVPLSPCGQGNLGDQCGLQTDDCGVQYDCACGGDVCLECVGTTCECKLNCCSTACPQNCG